MSTCLTAVWGPAGFRPVVLFADRTFRHLAQKTHTHPATGRRLTRWFRQRGMLGLLSIDVEVLIRESAKRVPEAVRQEIDRLKALCDDSIIVHSPGSSSASSGNTTMT